MFTPLTGHRACFTKTIQRELLDIVETYVHNTPQTGSRQFEEESRLTERTFESKSRKYDMFTFAGITICQKEDRYMMQKTLYRSKLKTLNLDYNFEEFRGRPYKIAWMTHTSPDICSSVALLSQITPGRFGRKAIKLANTTIQRIQ